MARYRIESRVSGQDRIEMGVTEMRVAYAYNRGQAVAELLSDPGQQPWPLPHYPDHEDLPLVDVDDMREQFGVVTDEMRQAFRDGYNERSRALGLLGR